jgi:hypothetical protein
MGEDDAYVATRIASERVSVSWGFEATTPAIDFRDQYCARARRGLFRLAYRLKRIFYLETQVVLK